MAPTWQKAVSSVTPASPPVAATQTELSGEHVTTQGVLEPPVRVRWQQHFLTAFWLQGAILTGTGRPS